MVCWKKGLISFSSFKMCASCSAQEQINCAPRAKVRSHTKINLVLLKKDRNNFRNFRNEISVMSFHPFKQLIVTVVWTKTHTVSYCFQCSMYCHSKTRQFPTSGFSVYQRENWRLFQAQCNIFSYWCGAVTCQINKNLDNFLVGSHSRLLKPMVTIVTKLCTPKRCISQN